MAENQNSLTIFNWVREIPHLIFNGHSSWEILEMGEGSSDRDGWQCDLKPITKAHLTLSSQRSSTLGTKVAITDFQWAEGEWDGSSLVERVLQPLETWNF